MASQNFATALALTLRYEGGYSDHPADPGGATNLGITRATLSQARGHAVSKADVKALTHGEAASIYRRNYWDAVQGDKWPAGLDAALFDYAVNSGPSAAVKALQIVLGCKADGHVSSSLLTAAASADVISTINALCRRRLGFLQRLRTFKTFGRGWRARVESIAAASLALAMHPATFPKPKKETA